MNDVEGPEGIIEGPRYVAEAGRFGNRMARLCRDSRTCAIYTDLPYVDAFPSPGVAPPRATRFHPALPAPRARILCERLELANATPRCGAKRRDYGLCRQPAMANGRCRMHGGKSTGPRTPEGMERC